MKRYLLLPIKPKHVLNILNGEKTLEIRKYIPKCNLPCEVYIYCCKGSKKHLYMPFEFDCFPEDECSQCYLAKEPILLGIDKQLDGKVVAKFTLNIADKLICDLYDGGLYFNGAGNRYFNCKNELIDLVDTSCLDSFELLNYIGDYIGAIGYAWHIDDLVIFDEPKELSDYGVKRAPQKYCYVKGD